MGEEEAGHSQVQGPGDPGILGLLSGDTELEAVLDIQVVHFEAVGDILAEEDIQADEDIQVEDAENIQQAEEGLLLGV